MKQRSEVCTMSCVIHLGVLLMISVTFAERGGCFSLMKPEMKNLALSSPSNTRDQLEGQRKISAPPKWQKNPVLCCTCQDFVNTASPKIDLKIQTKINKICNMLIPAMKTKCMRFGANLKRKILLSLFPGKTSRDTCKKQVKLCQY
ncbi:hypothetical protein HF521_021862 [Silurus meridionalis]|uniref:Saposin B-type domain-containing protein n=1 Tax=Silurus meridionalis TaxID=175797 RepID=A0A8T0BHA1_SILME|nr:hypothetical protein HF521_021862 [Silurus meridionalis]